METLQTAIEFVEKGGAHAGQATTATGDFFGLFIVFGVQMSSEKWPIFKKILIEKWPTLEKKFLQLLLPLSLPC